MARASILSAVGPALAAAALATLATPGVATPVSAAEDACRIEGVERIVAIGDVHGAADRLTAILRTAGLVDERLRWSGGRTHLVQVGDVVDRGPDSRQALDLLQRLQKEAASAGGRVHVLLGNHEVMRILGDLRFVTPGEFQAFVTRDSEGLKRRYIDRLPPAERAQRSTEVPLGFVDMILAFGPRGEYGRWVRTLNAVAKINGILFVHGGISPAVASLSCSEINATVHRELTADLEQTLAAPLSSLAAREDGPLWYRGVATAPDAGIDVDAILARQRARAMVVGHTVSTSGRITERFGGKVFQLDTGMQPAYVVNGRASALEIVDGNVTAIYEDRRDALSGVRVQPLPEGEPPPR